MTVFDLVNEMLDCDTKKELCKWMDELDERVEKDNIIKDPNDWVVLTHAFVQWKEEHGE